MLKGVAEIFRDSSDLRENRERARLKYLFLKHGWTAESFQEELERRIGFRLDPAVGQEGARRCLSRPRGIHQQKQPEYSYVGAAVLRGRVNAEQLNSVADLADRYADGQIRTTNMQNLVVVNVPHHNTQALAAD